MNTAPIVLADGPWKPRKAVPKEQPTSPLISNSFWSHSATVRIKQGAWVYCATEVSRKIKSVILILMVHMLISHILLPKLTMPLLFLGGYQQQFEGIFLSNLTYLCAIQHSYAYLWQTSTKSVNAVNSCPHQTNKTVSEKSMPVIYYLQIQSYCSWLTGK